MRDGPQKRFRRAFQRFVQKTIWGMDIHPSARIDPTALIDRTFPEGIHIGENCEIREESVVLSHDFVRGLYLHTRIGARSYLGARSIILPGLTIGHDCIVYPGAVVIRDMPAFSVAQGNPAAIERRVDLQPQAETICQDSGVAGGDAEPLSG